MSRGMDGRGNGQTVSHTAAIFLRRGAHCASAHYGVDPRMRTTDGRPYEGLREQGGERFGLKDGSASSTARKNDRQSPNTRRRTTDCHPERKRRIFADEGGNFATFTPTRHEKTERESNPRLRQRKQKAQPSVRRKHIQACAWRGSFR